VELIRASLALAEKHVADDARIIAMKRLLIDRRQRDGRVTRNSEKRLKALERRLERHMAERDRLLEILNAASKKFA
jgi:hypothetical protein